MKELNKKEMLKITGGANALLIGGIVATIITLVSGILKGYSNPQKCN